MERLTQGAIKVGMPVYNRLAKQVVTFLDGYETIEEAYLGAAQFTPDVTELADTLHTDMNYSFLYGYHALFYDFGTHIEALHAEALNRWIPVKPKKAINKFKKWKIFTRPQFDSLSDFEKAEALTAAGFTQASIKKSLQPALLSALNKGETLRDFKKKVGGKGGKFLNNAHAENVFRTNINKAYNQGHVEGMFNPAMADLIPGFIYKTVIDGRTTAICMERANKYYTKQDLLNFGIAAPCHYQCRSTLVAASSAEAQRFQKGKLPSIPAQNGFGHYNFSPVTKVAQDPKLFPTDIDDLITPDIVPEETLPYEDVSSWADIFTQKEKDAIDDIWAHAKNTGHEGGFTVDIKKKVVSNITYSDDAFSVDIPTVTNYNNKIIHTHPNLKEGMSSYGASVDDVMNVVANNHQKQMIIVTDDSVYVVERIKSLQKAKTILPKYTDEIKDYVTGVVNDPKRIESVLKAKGVFKPTAKDISEAMNDLHFQAMNDILEGKVAKPFKGKFTYKKYNKKAMNWADEGVEFIAPEITPTPVPETEPFKIPKAKSKKIKKPKEKPVEIPIIEEPPAKPRTPGKHYNRQIDDDFIKDVKDAKSLGKAVDADNVALEEQQLLITQEFDIQGKPITRFNGKISPTARLDNRLKELKVDADALKKLGIKRFEIRSQTFPDKTLKNKNIIVNVDKKTGLEKRIKATKRFDSHFDETEVVITFNDGDEFIYKMIGDNPDMSELYSILGEFEYSSKNPVTAELISARMERLANLIGAELKTPTKTVQEFKYLMQCQRYRKLLSPAEEKSLLNSVLRDGDKGTKKGIDEIKKRYKNHLGINVDKLPKGKYNYKPTFNSENKYGWKSTYRFDFTESELAELKGQILTHDITGGGDTVDKLLKIIDGGADGLVSTTEKIRTGIEIKGMSPTADMRTGGGSYTYTRLRQASQVKNETGIFFKTKALERTDSIWYYNDNFGTVKNNYAYKEAAKTTINWTEYASASQNEILFKRTLALDDIDFINFFWKEDAVKLAAELRKRGINEIGGKPLRDIIRSGSEKVL